MKTIFSLLNVVVILSLLALFANAFGQTPDAASAIPTTSYTGTVVEFTPNTISVKGNDSPAPEVYRFTKMTVFVDGNNSPVSVETVIPRVPVVVYYERNGDLLIADKVVVKQPALTAATDHAPADFSDPKPPVTGGIVSAADANSISLRTSSSTSVAHYKVGADTSYVDEGGNPIAKAMIRAGQAVTVYFQGDGDELLAMRVILKSTVAPDKTATAQKAPE